MCCRKKSGYIHWKYGIGTRYFARTRVAEFALTFHNGWNLVTTVLSRVSPIYGRWGRRVRFKNLVDQICWERKWRTYLQLSTIIPFPTFWKIAVCRLDGWIHCGLWCYGIIAGEKELQGSFIEVFLTMDGGKTDLTNKIIHKLKYCDWWPINIVDMDSSSA